MGVGEVVGIAANVIVASAASIALWIGWRQVSISREISALEAYENYHLLCLQYPKYSTGRIDFEKSKADELDSYTVFVLYTLMIGERIYSLFPNDKGWMFSIEEDIRIHRRFIASDIFSYHLHNQQWLIRPLIERVLEEPQLNHASHGWAQQT